MAKHATDAAERARVCIERKSKRGSLLRPRPHLDVQVVGPLRRNTPLEEEGLAVAARAVPAARADDVTGVKNEGREPKLNKTVEKIQKSLNKPPRPHP